MRLPGGGGASFWTGMPDPAPTRRPDAALLVIFLAALATHAWLATRNFATPFMAGHEFRQAQTALNSFYIDEQNNFGLLYETPVVGKPWVSILMEVPVYEWSVVIVSRLLDVPHILAARGVSLTCFYLTLPALYLLLGRIGLAPVRRLPALAMVVACPVYIYYSRAFLMESMELMCCAWFLHGYVRMMDERRWYWFVLASVAGTGASLVKSATLAVWLGPAAVWAAWQLWRDVRDRAGLGAILQTVFWGLAGVTIPLCALHEWVALTDPLKAMHASAWPFTAHNLSAGNWGLTDFGARFSGEVWRTLGDCWRLAVLPPWLLLTLLVGGSVALPRARWPALAVAAGFFWAQLLFPYAYAYQDYYFYACAVFVAAGLGVLMQELLNTRLPRSAAWALLMLPIVAGFANYRLGYYPGQRVQSEGGFAFTRALRDFLPKDAVIVVAGADWAAIIPFYSQRKALMIRGGLEDDPDYLARAFDDLAGENVGALVMFGAIRGHREFIDRTVAAFGLDSEPSFFDDRGDVYLNLRYREEVKAKLRAAGDYGLTNPPTPPKPVPLPPGGKPFRITPSLARQAFPEVYPAPLRANFEMGLGYLPVDGRNAIFAHPRADLWLRPGAGAARIEWSFGLIPAAYEGANGRTDGVDFFVEALTPGQPVREIYRRRLDPARRPADRGTQNEVIPHRAVPGELLHFMTRPGDNSAFDWAYWARIQVR